jgi:hypothetical protein
MATTMEDEIKAVALAALIDVAQNQKAPAAARAASSRTLLEAIGAIGRLQDLGRLDESKRNAAEMSMEEIQKEMAQLMGKMPRTVRMRKLKT